MFLSPAVQHVGAVLTYSFSREGVSGCEGADEAEMGEPGTGAQDEAAAPAENPGAGPQTAGSYPVVLLALA